MKFFEIKRSERFEAECVRLRPGIGRFDDLEAAIDFAVASKPDDFPQTSNGLRVGSTRDSMGGDPFPGVEVLWFVFRCLDENTMELVALARASDFA